MKKTLFILIMMMVSMMSFAKGEKTLVFTLEPQIENTKSETKIKETLRNQKGVKGVDVSSIKQTVTVLYNPQQTCEGTLVDAFKSLGYTATVKKSFLQKSKEKVAAAAESCGEALSEAYDATKEGVTTTYNKAKKSIEEKKNKKNCSCNSDGCKKQETEQKCANCKKETEQKCANCKKETEQKCANCKKETKQETDATTGATKKQ